MPFLTSNTITGPYGYMDLVFMDGRVCYSDSALWVCNCSLDEWNSLVAGRAILLPSGYSGSSDPATWNNAPYRVVSVALPEPPPPPPPPPPEVPQNHAGDGSRWDDVV